MSKEQDLTELIAEAKRELRMLKINLLEDIHTLLEVVDASSKDRIALRMAKKIKEMT